MSQSDVVMNTPVPVPVDDLHPQSNEDSTQEVPASVVSPETAAGESNTLQKLEADVKAKGTYDLVFVPNTSGQDRLSLLNALRNENFIAADALICYEFPCQTKMNQDFLRDLESVHQIVVLKTRNLPRSTASLSSSKPSMLQTELPPETTVKVSAYRQYLKSAESLQYATGGKSTSFGTIGASVIHVLTNTLANPKPQERVTNRSFSNVVFGDLRSKDGMATVLNLLQMNFSSRNCLIIGRGGPADQSWSAMQCTKSYDPTIPLETFLNTECKFFDKNPRGPRVRSSGIALITKYLAGLRNETNHSRTCLKAASEIYHYIAPCFELRSLRTQPPTNTGDGAATTPTQDTKHVLGPYVVDVFCQAKGGITIDEIFNSPQLYNEFMALPEVQALTSSESFQQALQKATNTKAANNLLSDRFPDVGTMRYYHLDGIVYVDVVTRTQKDIERRVADRKKQLASQTTVNASGEKSSKKRKNRNSDRPKRVQSEKSASAGINAPVSIVPEFIEFIKNHCQEIAEEVYPPFATNSSVIPRTKIVQLFSEYIERMNLLDTKNRTIINTSPLAAQPIVQLFRLPPDFVLDRFNINKYISNLIVGAKQRTKEELDLIRQKKKQNRTRDRIDLPKNIPKKGSLRNSLPDSVTQSSEDSENVEMHETQDGTEVEVKTETTPEKQVKKHAKKKAKTSVSDLESSESDLNFKKPKTKKAKVAKQ